MRRRGVSGACWLPSSPLLSSTLAPRWCPAPHGLHFAMPARSVLCNASPRLRSRGQLHLDARRLKRESAVGAGRSAGARVGHLDHLCAPHRLEVAPAPRLAQRYHRLAQGQRPYMCVCGFAFCVPFALPERAPCVRHTCKAGVMCNANGSRAGKQSLQRSPWARSLGRCSAFRLLPGVAIKCPDGLVAWWRGMGRCGGCGRERRRG